MRKLCNIFSHFIDIMVAGLLATIFLTFLLQVVSRYVFNAPIGWTLELISISWLWLIFIGAAFAVRERDHVRFDMIHLAASNKLRVVFGLISCVAIVTACMLAFYPTYEWAWESLMSRRDSALLKVPMSIVMSAILVFYIGSALRYTYLAIEIFRKGPLDQSPSYLEDAE